MEITNNQSDNGTPSREDAKSDWSDLDVRSQEVQEIIGRPPHWLIRWGITAFFGVLILVLLSAWTIKYPETIQASLRLTAINAPKTVESRINGKVVKLLSENNTIVQQGEILAWLESTASHEQVLTLATDIDSLRTWLREEEFEKIKSFSAASFTDLGELQGNFQTFEQTFREFLSYLPGGLHHQRQQMLQKELEYTQKLQQDIRERREIRLQSHELTQREYDAQKTLVDDNLEPSLSLVGEEKNLLSSRLTLKQFESSIINNELSQLSKQKQLMDLEQQIENQKSIFLQALNTLGSAIQDWESRYLFIAPVSGRLVYAGVVQQNQLLRSGQQVFYIKPETTRFFGEIGLPQTSLGKIREGQEVQVRFSSYPYQEFGTVTGRLDYISAVPVQDSVFIGRVSFPAGLTTNYGQELQPRNGMMGQAKIITQDMRLLDRFYNNVAKQIQ